MKPGGKTVCLTVLAVVEVRLPPGQEGRSAEDLLQDAAETLSVWALHDDLNSASPPTVDVKFISLRPGVSAAAKEAGAS